MKNHALAPLGERVSREAGRVRGFFKADFSFDLTRALWEFEHL